MRKEASLDRPDLTRLRKGLFGDTDIEKLNWRTQYYSIIKRVFERGSDQEKQLMMDFYGKDKIKEVTGSYSVSNNSLPILIQSKIQ
ncbi:DUF6922 domain-containing protein [Pedobacter soli]|uniref:DUF6922 domain-containing protein n=1 Tax=Pedobacter soli TaxID=390242 RepID=A0A1G6WV69_9SPHI|nr:hypothetical protein [Pedobacter soli]SDD69694.1 hypothetical protein SAMN04488024_107131 [Pedobacter soli]